MMNVAESERWYVMLGLLMAVAFAPRLTAGSGLRSQYESKWSWMFSVGINVLTGNIWHCLLFP